MLERNNEYVYQPPATEELRQRINNAGFSDEFKQQIKSAQKEEGRKMFERLSHRNKYGIAYTKIAANKSNIVDVGECYTGRIIDRLAAYEDTGLTPERIRAYVAELQNAFNILFESERQKQQENEQLQAQVARMREALVMANNYMPDIGHFCTCGKCKKCGTDINYAGYWLYSDLDELIDFEYGESEVEHDE